MIGCMRDTRNINLCRRWLALAVIALSFSGLLSIVVVLLRIPFINNLIGQREIFDSALVIHVNLSVLVWMLSMISLMWSMVVGEKYSYINNIIWWVSVIGTCFIALSIFSSGADSVKNNYIPILNNFIFLLGLGIFMVAMFANAILTILFSNVKTSFGSGVYCSAVFVIVACLCFVFARCNIVHGVDIYHFYEYLFWGGGHVLQFAYTQALISVCILFFGIVVSCAYNLCLAVNILLVVPVIFVYLLYPVDDHVLINFFTLHMKFVGGFLPIATMCIILFRIKEVDWNAGDKTIILFWSIVLFLYGGLLGFLIDGPDVTIPAHYHGSIIGITVALMGFSYFVLPMLGLLKISVSLRNLQISMYSVGQMLHISGLAWMGSYGAMRKVTDVPMSLAADIARFMFISGGIMTVIAGLVFVFIMIYTIFNGVRKKNLYFFEKIN